MKQPPTKLAAVIDVLDEMRRRSVIGDYAVGGAVAASLYVEPISTFDLDVFFSSTHLNQG